MWTLVTGGTSKLGAEICQTLAEKGYSIVIHYNKKRGLADEIAKRCQSFGVEAEVIRGDFSTLESVLAFSKAYQFLYPETKILINNASLYEVGSGLETLPINWMAQFQLNFHAPCILTKALSASLIELKGSIINLGVAGLQRRGANTYSTAYTLSKEALWGWTRALAKELAPKQVSVNMVSPGMLSHSVDLPADLTTLPMKRAITCLEVCRMISFLLDPQNQSITGQNIEVAGGFCLA